MLRVGISGFGRIGRMFLRAAIAQGALGRDFDIVMINNRSGAKTNAHLFKYDSTQGIFDGTVEASDTEFIVNGKPIKWIGETSPENIPWSSENVDIVVESTGRFRKREQLEAHIKGGAKRVLISAPGEGVPMIVPGVNNDKADHSETIFSLASCTTNCLAPMVKVLHDNFGLEKGFMTTVHAYTSDQRILDGSHKDLRRARAGAVSIIPTSTGAAKAIGKIMPELSGKLDGISLRVPVPDGSITDLSATLSKEVTKEEVNSAFKKASETSLKGILQYTEEPIVSVDIIGNQYSIIFDSLLTNAMGNTVKIFGWYDNEYGYSCRLVDFIKEMGTW